MNDDAPEVGPHEVLCPDCHLYYHGPLKACPVCKERA